MFTRIALAGAALTAMVTTPALASSQKDLNLCIAALSAEAPGAEFEFERKSGTTVSKLRFEMTTADGDTKDVVCKVRRGEVIELDMGE